MFFIRLQILLLYILIAVLGCTKVKTKEDFDSGEDPLLKEDEADGNGIELIPISGSGGDFVLVNDSGQYIDRNIDAVDGQANYTDAGEELVCSESNFTICDGKCVDTSVEIEHCGGCGQPCPDIDNGEPTCEEGICDIVCNDDSLFCNDECVLDDEENCGECEHDCTALDHVVGNVTCKDGVCNVPLSSCAPGYTHCTNDPDDGCETELSDSEHCGSCDNVCPEDEPLCAKTAESSTEEPEYECTNGCPPHAPTICDQTCVDLSTDPDHCSECDYSCEAPEHGQPICKDSVCDFTCNDSYKICDDECIREEQCCNDDDCSGSAICQSGECLSWCALQTVPKGIEESDYQCLDFDNGLPSTDTWSRNESGTGILEVDSSLATSDPNSLYLSVSAAETNSSNDQARISWTSNDKSQSIQSVTLTADIYYPRIDGIVTPPWTGFVEIMCIRNSSSVYCLKQVFSTVHPDYNGLQIEERQYLGAVGYNNCNLSSLPPGNVWSQIEFHVTTDGPPEVRFNGTTATNDCVFSLVSSSSVVVNLGLKTQPVTNIGWSVYFDNVQVMVHR